MFEEGLKMVKILPESKIKEAIKNETFISNAKEENAEGIKYDFSLGSRVLKAKYGLPIDINELPEEEKKRIGVEPGEVVFVLTKERLKLPINMKAELIHKRKISHDGILTLGGLCIDPLYEGHLLVGLYNFSSDIFPLIPDRKLIAASFYELEKEEIGEFKKPTQVIDDFPDDLIRLMKKYSPISVQGLLEKLNELKIELKNLKEKFQNREEWFERFEKNLDKQFDLIKEEREARIEVDKKFETNLTNIIWKVGWLSGTITILGSLAIGYVINILLK